MTYKKLFAALLALLFVVTGSLPVLAAGEQAALTVTPSTPTVAPGETFTVTVDLSNNPGLWSVEFHMAIDTEVFEVTSVSVGNLFAGVGYASFDKTEKIVKVNLYNNAPSGAPVNVTADGTVATITLKALEAATLADYTLTAAVQAQNVRNAAGTILPLSAGACAVTIKERISEITKADVALGTDVTVNYYATLANGQTNANMVFTMNGKETTVAPVATATTGLYCFSYEKVAPQCMGDSIKAELKLGDTVLDAYDGFSVRAYCDRVTGMRAEELGMSDAKKAALNTLTADLLAYGAAAQTYRSYKTDALANAGYAYAASEYVELDAYNEKMISTPTDANFQFTGANLYYSNAVSLYLQFVMPTNDGKTYALRIKDWETQSVLKVYHHDELAALANDGSNYQILLDPFSAVDFSAWYTIELCTVTTGRGGALVYTPNQYIEYSVAAYVYSMQNKTDANGLTAMARLARATYNYGLAAEAYAAAK